MRPEAYTAIQLEGILGGHHVKLVPEIAVQGGDGGASALGTASVGRLLRHERKADPREKPES